MLGLLHKLRQQLAVANKVPAATKPMSMLRVFNRQYWVQVGIILLAVLVGVAATAFIMKGLLLSTALQQEVTHYWQRFDKNPHAPLPDTKNLYGYLWHKSGIKPVDTKGQALENGVHYLTINGKKRLTAYSYRKGYHLLLVFGESNTDRIIWFFGLLPLMLTLVALYSILWALQRSARNTLSPVAKLAKKLASVRSIGLKALMPDGNSSVDMVSPFAPIDTGANLEAAALKQALGDYHQSLLRYVIREQRFTAEIGHELRTPMAVIKSNAQLLLLAQPESVPVKRIGQALDQMAVITNSLLALARQDKTEINPTQSLLELLKQSIADNSEALSTANLSVTLPANDLVVPCSPTLVYMAFSNLVRNAITYAHASNLSISFNANGIHFADNGIGFSAEMLVRLQHINNEDIIYNPTAEGHGIGLVLVQRLAAVQGWTMRVDNNHSGGAVITLNCFSANA